jgi:hypothetical protein
MLIDDTEVLIAEVPAGDSYLQVPTSGLDVDAHIMVSEPPSDLIEITHVLGCG